MAKIRIVRHFSLGVFDLRARRAAGAVAPPRIWVGDGAKLAASCTRESNTANLQANFLAHAGCVVRCVPVYVCVRVCARGLKTQLTRACAERNHAACASQ